MDIKKYMITSFLLLSCVVYSMDSPAIEDSKDEKIDIRKSSNTSESRLNKNSSPGVLTGLKSSNLGNKDKTVIQNGRDLRKLVKSRSVSNQQQTRGRKVPAFNQEKFEEIKNKTSNKGKSREYTDDEITTMISKLGGIKYSLEDVEKLLSDMSSIDEYGPLSQRLHELGVKNHVPLNRLKEHAELFGETDITPRALADAVYLLIGEKNKKPQKFEVERYEKVAKDSPEKYEELIFCLFEALLNKDAAKKSGIEPTNVIPTDLVDFHAGALTNEIKSQQEARRQWILAVITTVMGWVLTGIGWGVQASQSCDSSVNGTQTF